MLGGIPGGAAEGLAMLREDAGKGAPFSVALVVLMEGADGMLESMAVPAGEADKQIVVLCRVPRRLDGEWELVTLGAEGGSGGGRGVGHSSGVAVVGGARATSEGVFRDLVTRWWENLMGGLARE